MNIYFSPVSSFEGYVLGVVGDSIIINGEQHQLSDLISIGEGQEYPKFIVSAKEGEVTVLLPYWDDASDAVLFPEPIINAPDGLVTLPGG